MRAKLKAKLVGTGFLAIGALFLGIGIYYTYTRVDFLGGCSEARAVVVDIYWEEGYDSETGYYKITFPVFQFADPRTDRQVTARSSVGGLSSYSVGQEVDILYDPENPTSAVLVKSFWDLWLPSVICLPMGSMATTVGLYIIKKVA